MKRMIKTSLVAAVAVAGFTTAATAADAPKISGSLAHQVQKKDSADNLTWNTKVSLKASGKASDKVSYFVSYAERISQTSDTNATTTTDSDAYKSQSLNLSDAYFTAKVAGATVIAGRQGLTTPWTNGGHLIDGTEHGNGVLALVPAGPVTVVGVYMASSNISNDLVDQSSDIGMLALLGKAGMVNLQAWYANIGKSDDKVNKGLSAYTFAANTKVAGVSIDARYSALSTDTAGVKDQSLSSIALKTKVAGVTLNAGVAKAGKDGDLVSLDSFANDKNSIYEGAWNLHLGDGKNPDATLVGVGASVPFAGIYKASVNFASRTGSKINDQKELKAQISADIAKNFSLYLRAAKVTSDTSSASSEFTRTRLYAAYKF